jgi:hypothetical protein
VVNASPDDAAQWDQLVEFWRSVAQYGLNNAIIREFKKTLVKEFFDAKRQQHESTPVDPIKALSDPASLRNFRKPEFRLSAKNLNEIRRPRFQPQYNQAHKRTATAGNRLDFAYRGSISNRTL